MSTLTLRTPLPTPARTFTTDVGRAFAVRVLPTGARYGRANTLVTDAPMVEFYDLTYADDGDGATVGYGPLGQFVSRSYLATVLGRDGYGTGMGGIDFDGATVWRIDGPTMRSIRTWLATTTPRA